MSFGAVQTMFVRQWLTAWPLVKHWDQLWNLLNLTSSSSSPTKTDIPFSIYSPIKSQPEKQLPDRPSFWQKTALITTWRDDERDDFSRFCEPSEHAKEASASVMTTVYDQVERLQNCGVLGLRCVLEAKIFFWGKGAFGLYSSFVAFSYGFSIISVFFHWLLFSGQVDILPVC